MVYGKPGVGKTRVAIEACKKFIECNNDYNIKFIIDKNREIYEDLEIIFSEADKKFIVFIDDANRQSALDQILYFTKENKDKLILILTVRDYAYQKTFETIKSYFEQYYTLMVDSFKHSEIKDILNVLNIRNPLWIDRIWDISKGNARIALMAANVGKKLNHIIALSNIEEVYNKYYESISKDLSAIDLDVLGVISFFSIIDLKNEPLMKSIEENFGINSNVFIEQAMKLHTQELIDMWEDEIVKFSDQVLQTYIFYKSYIKDKTLDFSVILIAYYKNDYSEKIKDQVYSSIISFNAEFIIEQLLPILNEKLLTIKDDKSELIYFYEIFWFLKQTETLEFINSEINTLPYINEKYNGDFKGIDIKDNYINILRKFINTKENDFRISIEILFDYIQRKPDLIPQFFYYIEHDIGIKRYSHNLHYKQQLIFIKYLFEDIKSIQTLDVIRLFTALHFSKIIYEDSWMISKNEFHWTPFSLILCDEMKEIRRIVWDYLIDKFQHGKDGVFIFNILNTYLDQIRFKSQIEANIDVVKYDIRYILEFISCLSTSELQHCIFVHKYANNINKQKIINNELLEIKEEFSTELYRLYKILTERYWELKDFRESEKKKKELLISYIDDFNLKDYIKLLRDYHLIKSECNERTWEITNSIHVILVYLYETDFSNFYKLIMYIIIDMKNVIQLEPKVHINNLLSKDTINITNIYEITTVLL